jgi:hypothetical protein
MVCHSRAANYVLGLSTAQMNKVHDYGSARVNQLTALEGLGIFRVNLLEDLGEVKGLARMLAGDITRVPRKTLDVLMPSLSPAPPYLRRISNTADGLANQGIGWLQTELSRPLDWAEKTLQNQIRYSTALPKRPTEYGKLVDPSDNTQSLDARARSYLHANCSQCHVEAGGGNALMELEFHQKRKDMRVVGVKPLHHTFDVPDAKLIDPGHPEKSMLYLRIARRGEGQMPPLATSLVDREAVQLIHDWIKRMR